MSDQMPNYIDYEDENYNPPGREEYEMEVHQDMFEEAFRRYEESY